ncbi:MAG TPA: M48 family metallopeptidase [Planctomycetota bacterium]|nr:M48 family metallopeptidase [Planctomycetota bacterium]
MDPSTPGRGWLLFRAALAVGLTVVFYAFSVALALGLFAVAWWMMSGRDRVNGYLLVACIVGGITILWAVVPRWERFVPPGPRLTRERQPRLFALLESVARAAGQEMPAEVYLAPDVNAGVTERGGLLGFGGRRVMILGLPLMAALRVEEFRGVLAHEFGHFHGGETRIGPWIYRTHEAIARTVRTLTEAGSLLRFLFIGYAKAFNRITQAVSRRQELLADRLAAAVAGAPAMASGLRRTAAAVSAFQPYFGTEVVPALSSGFRPPLAEGFGRFLGARPIEQSLDRFVDDLVKEERADPYDSHPPLRVRLESLGNPDPPDAASAGPVAATLLQELDVLEDALLAAAFPGLKIPPAIPWSETAERVYLPHFRKIVAEDRVLLAGVTADGLADTVSRPPGDTRWRRKAAAPAPQGPPKVATIAGAALVLHMVERGWALRSEPGRDFALSRGEESFFPFQEIGDLASGTTSAAGWRERCRALGIEGLPLESAPTKEPGTR